MLNGNENSLRLHDSMVLVHNSFIGSICVVYTVPSNCVLCHCVGMNIFGIYIWSKFNWTIWHWIIILNVLSFLKFIEIFGRREKIWNKKHCIPTPPWVFFVLFQLHTEFTKMETNLPPSQIITVHAFVFLNSVFKPFWMRFEQSSLSFYL